MNKYLFKKVRSDIKEHYKLYIFYIIIIFISFFRLNYYIFSPGSLVDLTNRINVENSYKVVGTDKQVTSTFTSSNTNVVTVSENGEIKAVGNGEAIIVVHYTIDGMKK